MEILSSQTVSGVFTGVAGAADWLVSKVSSAAEWVNAKMLDVGGLFNAIGSGLKGIGETIKSGWNWLTGWFRKDPIKAGLIVGGTILVGGALVLSGGAILGAVSGGIAAISGIVSAGASAIGGAITAGGVAGIFGRLALGGLIGGLGAWLVRGIAQIYNFNWNASDTDIRKQQEAYLKNLAISAGGALGQALGGLVCGATPGLATVRVDVTLLANLWAIIDEDTKEEILEAFTGLILMTKRAATQLAFLETYKNARKWVKANVRTGIGSIDKAIAGWGAEGSKSWSFASAIEEWTESFDNKTLGSAVQEGIEEFMDSCSEALLQIV